MFKAFKLKGHNYFLIRLDAPGSPLFNYVYEDETKAREITDKANAEEWFRDYTSMQVNFKMGKWFFVTEKSEKFNIRFVGLLHNEKDGESLISGTVRFTHEDLEVLA